MKQRPRPPGSSRSCQLRTSPSAKGSMTYPPAVLSARPLHQPVYFAVAAEARLWASQSPAWGVASSSSWNCAVSVDPDKAVVDELPTAERTITRQESSPNPIGRHAVLAVVKTATRRLRRGSAASLDRRSARHGVAVQAGQKTPLQPNKATIHCTTPHDPKRSWAQQGRVWRAMCE
jgi:hypothetical protein